MSTNIVSVDEFHASRYFAYMTPEQCRAARAWLQLSQDDLAIAAAVSNSTIRDFEAGRREPIQATKAAMRAELERRGIAFGENAISYSNASQKTS
jgi:DNA-binding transcriptional regulator YiaG